MCRSCDKNTTLTKQCDQCGEIKSLIKFAKAERNKTDGHRNKCNVCDAIRHKTRYEKLKNSEKEYIEFKKCSNCNEIKHRDLFCVDNGKKTGLRSNCKKCDSEKYDTPKNREMWAIRMRKFRSDPIKKAKEANRRSINLKRKKQENTAFKLRHDVSRTIRTYLKKNRGSKNGNSILKYLPYTIEELKQHIESQFEPWMNWSNHGLLNLTKRTWQIDHIIPQSELPYDSMEHPNFLKCWALENLRPLDAIENARKGNKIIIIENKSEDTYFSEEDELKSA